MTAAKDSELVRRAGYFAKLEAEADQRGVDASSLFRLAEAAPQLEFAERLPAGIPILSQPEKPFGPYRIFRTGPGATWGDYLREWSHFVCHWEVAASNRSGGEYPAFQVWSAVMAEGHVSLDAKIGLVLELWSDRWMLEAFQAGRMIRSLEAAHGTPQDAQRLESSVEEVTSALVRAKQESANLDEWFGALHALSPHVHKALQLADALDSNKEHRLLDEVQADLGAVLSWNVALYLRKQAFSDQHLERDYLGNLPTKRDLRYKLNARVFFPRFWYDLAVRWLESPFQELPSALNEIHFNSALGYAFSYSFDFSATSLSWELPLANP